LLSEAGGGWFSASRGRKAATNDADRLRQYLKPFRIEWAQIRRYLFCRVGKNQLAAGQR
jgi:sigma54-dependent transcription regulator